MPFGIENLLMLLGLGALAIPPLIHLLNRRRFLVVDWGAMQFLQISETTRRRLIIEEVLLMMLRMGLIAIMVLALAAPYLQSVFASRFIAQISRRPSRDVVIVFDGSYSMGYTGAPQTPHEAAKDWALAYVNELNAGDSVALFQAKEQVVPIVGEPSVDLEKVRKAIGKMPEPRGSSNWPAAVQTALATLQASHRPLREVIILSDGQRVGWSDENSLLRWELLANNLTLDPANKPNVWVVNVAPERKKDPPNWTLTPLRASRAVASVEQEIRFRTALQLHGQESYSPPYRLRLEVDGGKERINVPFPATAKLEKGQVPLEFTHRFTTPGSHLVSLVVEPDRPFKERPLGYQVKDELPGDNRQDLSVEVVKAMPVLIVDGDNRASPKYRGCDFLRDALAPANDLTPAILARVVPVQVFTPSDLRNDVDPKKKNTRPRVLILVNVPRLTKEQNEAILSFLNAGGSILVTLGERVDAAYYNEQLFKGGDGWLPARLEDKAGSETEKRGVSPHPPSFYHPALSLFRESASGGLADARFPRWWKVETPGKNSPSAPVALFGNTDPFFVERAFGQGRVILCSVPMDNSWRTNFPNLLAFAPLAHELIYYLAGARATDFNLKPGQQIRYRPEHDEEPHQFTIQPPDGESKALPNAPWPPVHEETRETGVYVLNREDGKRFYYVVQPDLHESDLTLRDDTDRKALDERLGNLLQLGKGTTDKFPLNYENDREKVLGEATVVPPKMELWWWFMIGVTLLLCSEVWMTRRIVKNR